MLFTIACFLTHWKKKKSLFHTLLIGYLIGMVVVVPEGGTPDFKRQEWSKDVLGFEIFGFGIFLGRKILASIFLAAWFTNGFLGVFKTIWRFMMVISFNAFWKFLWLRDSAWDFLGVKFWSRDFLGFDFCTHSIIPVTWNRQYHSWDINWSHFRPRKYICSKMWTVHALTQ